MRPNKFTITINLKESVENPLNCEIESAYAPNRERMAEDISQQMDRLEEFLGLNLVGSGYNFITSERDLEYEVKVSK